jgi:transcriptional regulator with XRE-family HTH domain
MTAGEIEKRNRVDLNSIGGRIQYQRITAGWSRAQLGARMGMSPSTVSGHERNENGHTSPKLIQRFATALGCKPTDLDPTYRETIEFLYTGNNEFLIVNAHEETLERYNFDRYPTKDIGNKIALLSRAGHVVTIHPTH